jgi:VIT1/CCC1 family predicted Fe2+/Mn2+ transporter
MQKQNGFGATQQESAWFNWLMQKPTLVLSSILTAAAIPVVVSTVMWGKYGAMVALSLMVAFITGVFFGQVSERKRTGVLAGVASGVATAGVFALVLLLLGAS